MAIKRSETDKRDRWDIEGMYPDAGAWEKDLEKAERLAEGFGALRGSLSDSGEALLSALKQSDELGRAVEKVFVYARMKMDEDNGDSARQAMADRACGLLTKAETATAFFEPELLAIPRKMLEEYRAETKGLSAYAFYIDALLHQRKHVLSGKEEAVLAALGESLSAPSKIFSMLNDADMKFGYIKGEDGKKTLLTHGNYIRFMESRDRRVRRSAYKTMYGAYGRQLNTLAASYGASVKKDAAMAKVRKYGSSIEAALDGEKIPVAVYENLLDTVDSNIGALHRYMGLRAKILGLPKLSMYDVYVPLFRPVKENYTFEEAVGIMERGLAPLGREYRDAMMGGVKSGWIDKYENEGKTSGAYSFGSYDSKPYILMNFDGNIRDVFTLAHEMGHSMHSFFTRRKQPFRYGGHSIFTAEVASTVNESLLMHYLLENSKDVNEKRYVLNKYIEEFRTTLFRQAMFAKFEKLAHGIAEEGGALTPDLLMSLYGGLNEDYFGKKVAIDGDIRMEWARIPHFYRAFYVYQYATGFSAATAISRKIIREGEPAVKQYLKFLGSGNSDYPIELLKIAGVDMGRAEPLNSAMDVFRGLVDELEAVI